MQVFFINNDGGGFADYTEVAEGTTVGQFFRQQIPDGNPNSYHIRVNRQAAPAGQALQNGDRVSITPLKIEGAR